MNTAIANLEGVPNPESTAVDTRLTVDATAGGVQLDLSALHRNTTHYELDVQDADVLVTFDGSAPTTTNGHYLANGTKMRWRVATATVAKFIRAGGTDAAVHASQFTY